jgi:predicted GIY-YIG superfamily endonuclease
MKFTAKGWLYILRCCDGSYYVGSTSDLEQRLAAHSAGEGGDYTRQRLPATLLWTQEFPTLWQAFECERQIKGWSRAKKEALMRGDHQALQELSTSRMPGAGESTKGSR